MGGGVSRLETTIFEARYLNDVSYHIIRCVFEMHKKTIKRLERYFILQCTECRNIQVCEIKSIVTYFFKCKSCNKRFKIKRKNVFGLICRFWGSTNSITESVKICQASRKAQSKLNKL